jgi:hypothetical protein
MWLKIVYDEDDIPKWANKHSDIKVALDYGVVAPTEDIKSFRVSPIFPLVKDIAEISIENTEIYFFNFKDAYRLLGKIERSSSQYLRESIYFSNGLSSIILISSNKKILKEFKRVVEVKENAFEKWTVKDSRIVKIFYEVNNHNEANNEVYEIVDYSILPITERALIDEFKISIKFLLIKLTTHMPSEMPKIKKLIDELNSLIGDLVFLSNVVEQVPSNLSEYSVSELKSPRLNSILRNQILDRIIQVNSALSYVSTQAFSGAIPILERRSLVRRSSLLGIGSAILALNNIARFIENCFSKIDINEIITSLMPVATPLKGTSNLPYYDISEWYKSAVNSFNLKTLSTSSYFKLPYFNGRLGFRETEYSIAAAIQSISSGASLEWSLMTITHEMLHGHVRNIITSIFYGNDSLNRGDQREQFYKSFLKKKKGDAEDEKLIDSIRAIFFTYCCFTVTHGSITSKKEPPADKFKLVLLDQETLWSVFENENRNINEIFVHVLDLHYFYASRITIYIPLIWCSWAAVPYTSGDLRQYILRSLLTIASKTEGPVHGRFNECVSTLEALLDKYKEDKLKYPITEDILDILQDKEMLRNYYFPAFKGSIMLVDMVKNIFVSSQIRAEIFDDILVSWQSDETEKDNIEEVFIYNLSSGFNDEEIKSPTSYLLAKMAKELNTNSSEDDIERETALQFLALNSN